MSFVVGATIALCWRDAMLLTAYSEAKNYVGIATTVGSRTAICHQSADVGLDSVLALG